MGERSAVEVTLHQGGGEPWQGMHVVAFEGVEGISQLFRFTLTLYSKEQVQPADALHADLTLTLTYSDELVRHVNGVVAGFTFMRTISNLESSTSESLNVYQAVLVPKAWRMNLASNCRIFLNKDVLTILDEVLKANGLHDKSDFEIPIKSDKALAWSGGPRDQPGFRVQYQETDWNFLARFMEEFGIFFYFTHSEGGHQLRLGNTCRHYGKGEPDRLEVGEQITSFQLAAAICPDAVRLSDFHPARPHMDLSHVAGVSESKLQLYEPASGSQEEGQIKALAKIRLEEAQVGALKGQGTSDCIGLEPGHTVTLAGGKKNPAADGDFLVTWVEHRAANASPDDRYEEHSLGYENSFSCIPAEVVYKAPEGHAEACRTRGADRHRGRRSGGAPRPGSRWPGAGSLPLV